MRIKLAWQKLLVDQKSFVTRDQLEPICAAIGKDYRTVVHYLLEHKFLIRTFRGIFYVRGPDEIQRGITKPTVYELMAKSLELKMVTKWYYGLETALKFNNMTHEYFRVNYVITNSLRTTKAIKVLDTEFRFIKWRPAAFEVGLKTMNGLGYSDKEKTILDLIYARYTNKKMRNKDTLGRAKDLLVQYGGQLDIERFERYISNYPIRMGNIVWQALDESSLRD
jgi:hypothetical protein